MKKTLQDALQKDKTYQDLARKQSRLAWILSFTVFIVYFGYILTIAYFPELLSRKISQSSILTWGIPIGIAIIFTSFFLTGLYVYIANTRFDTMLKTLQSSVRKDHA